MQSCYNVTMINVNLSIIKRHEHRLCETQRSSRVKVKSLTAKHKLCLFFPIMAAQSRLLLLSLISCSHHSMQQYSAKKLIISTLILGSLFGDDRHLLRRQHSSAPFVFSCRWGAANWCLPSAIIVANVASRWRHSTYAYEPVCKR